MSERRSQREKKNKRAFSPVLEEDTKKKRKKLPRPFSYTSSSRPCDLLPNGKHSLYFTRKQFVLSQFYNQFGGLLCKNSTACLGQSIGSFLTQLVLREKSFIRLNSMGDNRIPARDYCFELP